MEKISVTVRVPALDSTFDFLVPSNMAVCEVQKLMIRILNSEYNVSNSIENLVLFDKETATVLRSECSFGQLCIGDGSKLILI